MQNNTGPMASPCCTQLEQSILRLSPESIWKNAVADLSRAVTFGDERRECRQASGRLHEHRRPFDGVEGVGAVREDQSVFRLVVHPGA